MDINPFLDWAGALALLLAVGTSIWTIMAGPSKSNAARIEAVARHSDLAEVALGKRLDAHDLRLGGLEQSLRTMPSKDHLHELHIGMEALKGALLELRAVVEGSNRIMTRVEAIVARHDEHLLDGSKK